MHNELKLNIYGKVSNKLTLQEKNELLTELEERVCSLLEAYGVYDIKYTDMITKVVYIDDSWED